MEREPTESQRVEKVRVVDRCANTKVCLPGFMLYHNPPQARGVWSQLGWGAQFSTHPTLQHTDTHSLCITAIATSGEKDISLSPCIREIMSNTERYTYVVIPSGEKGLTGYTSGEKGRINNL